MLKIDIPKVEGFDDEKGEFIEIIPETHLQLEHSLVSLSKWESKWHKPFLTKEEKPLEETIDYIRCMTTTQNVNPDVYKYLSASNIKKIEEYIKDPMTASTFKDTSHSNRSEIITSETFYYWMISLNIPFECQKWHLNKLLALIKMCSIKNSPGKKMSNREIMANNKALNEARRAKLNTRG